MCPGKRSRDLAQVDLPQEQRHENQSNAESQVARATGHAELADNIQEGVRAWEVGDDATATRCIGRAVQLAHEAGDDQRLEELASFAEIRNPATGTVVIRKDADKVAAMTLDTHSTKTVLPSVASESGSP